VYSHAQHQCVWQSAMGGLNGILLKKQTNNKPKVHSKLNKQRLLQII